jgi:hypothetical protein
MRSICHPNSTTPRPVAQRATGPSRERPRRDGRAERVYIASSRSTSGTALYGRRVGQIRERFADAELVEPSREFDSVGHWLSRRDAVLRSVCAVVFFADANGFIGRGVWRDLALADALGREIWFLAGDGEFVPIEDVGFGIEDDGPWDEYAVVGVRPYGSR